MQSWQLRSRLLLFAMVTLIPLILFGSVAIQKNVEHTKRQILNSSVAIARVLETTLSEMITSTEHMLITLGRSPTLRNQDVSQTRKLFIDVFPLQPSLLNLAATDSTGYVFASIVWGGMDSRSINQDPVFQSMLQTETLTISNRTISTATDQPAVRLYLPYYDDTDAPLGALLAEISLSQLQRSLSSISMEENATFIITDAQGTVLIHPNYTYVSEGADISTLPSVRAALQGEQGTMEHSNPEDNKRWLWAYTPIDNTGWAVVVGYPTEIAYPPIHESLRQSLLLFLAMITAAGILAFVLSKRLVHPIRELTRSADAISSGDLDQQVTVQGGIELRHLARAFNTMAMNLKQKIEELAAAKEEISQKARRLRILLARTISLQEDERQRIAVDLHDGISQFLLAALYETEAAKDSLEHDPSHTISGLEKAQYLLEQTSTEMRRVIYDLRPPLLDDIGFLPALEHYINDYMQRTRITVSLNITGPVVRLDPNEELALYRISQEALHNIHRHARTTSAEILVDFQNSRIHLTIRDHGVGFDYKDLEADRFEKMGLPGMQERAESIGAVLSIHSTPGHGTTVELNMHIENE